MSTIVHATAGTAALSVALLALCTRRLGPSAWSLAIHTGFLALGSLGLAAGDAGAGWSRASAVHAAWALLLVAAPFALLYTRRLSEESTGRPARLPALLTGTAFVASATLVGLVYVLPGPWRVDPRLAGANLGPAGPASALCLMGTSVLVLANLERTLRCAEEHIRWEMKFLALGLALLHGSGVWLASHVLLYDRLPRTDLETVSWALLPASIFMTVSWKRGRGAWRIAVSQDLAYSSITFLFVGLYLVGSSLLARWAGSVLDVRIDEPALVFLLAVAALGSFLLSSSLRRRTKHWVRRNLFSGLHDYRAAWLEALERVRAREGSEAAAEALADMVQRAVAAIHVSVWVRDRATGRLRLLAARGPYLRRDVPEGRERIRSLEEGSGSDLLASVAGSGAPGLAATFRRASRSEVLVPLASDDEVLGCLGVGADGRTPFDWEAREFLSALAEHAAGELRRIELEEERERAREAEAFRTFSTFLLHDLKNFATTLTMISRNATRHADNPEFRHKAFESVRKTAERIQDLCNSLRTFSGDLTLQRAPADLNEIVREAMAGIEDGLCVDVRLDLGDLPLVPVDGKAMGRVLRNLVLNADEAAGEGGRVVVRTRCAGKAVELSITDDGPGIPAHVLDDLFVPFRTTKSRGLGIGLFQSREIVEGHGGSIHVESREGEGTEVVARLPTAAAAPSARDG